MRVAVAIGMSQLLTSTLGLAKLDIVRFDDLLKESSLIVLARAMDAKIDNVGHGRAHLRVKRVVRGQYPEATLTIDWSGLEDEQRLAEVGREYLLFLRKSDDRYTAAILGVSFWSVTNTFDGQAVEYTHPVNMVTVAEGLITSIEPPEVARPNAAKGCRLELISLDRLLQEIRRKRVGTG